MGEAYGHDPEKDGDLSIKAQEIRADWSRFMNDDDLNDPRIRDAMDRAAEDAANLPSGSGEKKP